MGNDIFTFGDFKRSFVESFQEVNGLQVDSVATELRNLTIQWIFSFFFQIFLVIEDWQSWRHYWAEESFLTSGVFFSSTTTGSFSALFHVFAIFVVYTTWQEYKI